MGKIYVITGHYGSGKTNFAVNLALFLKGNNPEAAVTLCDLDIVNPYFRSADFVKPLEKRGIKTLAPQFANTSLDIPALNFDLSACASGSDFLIIDVGGDDAGATALGRYSHELMSADGFSALYVINRYRKLTDTPEKAAQMLKEIEKTSRIKHTGVVNNSNLGAATDFETVEKSVEFAERVCALTGLELFCTAAKKSACANLPKAFPCEIFVRPVWEMGESEEVFTQNHKIDD